MTPEEKRQFEQMKKELAEIKNYTSNLGGSLEFRTLVETYAAGGSSGASVFNTVTVNGDLDHNGNKVGFFGTTPVTQRTDPTSPSGGSTVDTEARTAIDELRTVLSDIGITS